MSLIFMIFKTKISIFDWIISFASQQNVYLLFLQSVLQQASSFLGSDKNGALITDQEIEEENILLYTIRNNLEYYSYHFYYKFD